MGFLLPLVLFFNFLLSAWLRGDGEKKKRKKTFGFFLVFLAFWLLGILRCGGFGFLLFVLLCVYRGFFDSSSFELHRSLVPVGSFLDPRWLSLVRVGSLNFGARACSDCGSRGCLTFRVLELS